MARRKEPMMLTPRQRWGTCCPFDPECDHSFMGDYDFDLWMDSPISDDKAAALDPQEDTDD